MSMFLCAACDQMKDSDDGAEEYKHHQLICADCIAERDEDSEPINPNVDMSYEGIYSALRGMGCPDDIAHELAKEKCK